MARFESFWDVICDFKDYLWLGIMVLIFLLILTGIGLLLGRPNEASFLVAMMNLVLILGTGAVMGWMYRVCLARETEYY